MPSSPRYTLIEVENRGHRVAVIEDTRRGKVLRIRRKGQRFLFWDLNDEVVTDPELRRVARRRLKPQTSWGGGVADDR